MSQTALPDFVVIGAMRAGTTSVHNYFELHPQVSMSVTKEPDFFREHIYKQRDEAWYAAQFDACAHMRGEASPNYTKVDVFPGVPERMHAHLPDAKLIYIVRDPVKRFVSQYQHMASRGFDLPEPDVMCATSAKLPDEVIRITREDDQYLHILSVSCYARQLREYLKVYPLDQIMFVQFEEMNAQQTETLTAIQRFIGVDCVGPEGLPELNRSNELGKVPAPLLKAARNSKIGSAIRDKVGLKGRDRLKRMMAQVFPKKELPTFSEASLTRIAEDLQADITKFRDMTGLPLSGWKI
ncbi:MAG: sulfotransferase [Pseudomonadota bacterium]